MLSFVGSWSLRIVREHNSIQFQRPLLDLTSSLIIWIRCDLIFGDFVGYSHPKKKKKKPKQYPQMKLRFFSLYICIQVYLKNDIQTKLIKKLTFPEIAPAILQ